MDSPWFSERAWGLALTLAERQALRPSPVNSPTGDVSESTRRRHERWRTQPPFFDEEFLVQRLAAAGVTPDQFLDLLAASPADIATQTATPAWVAAWVDALAMAETRRREADSAADAPNIAAEPAGAEDPTDEPAEDEPDNDLLNLLVFVNPMIDLAVEQLRAGLAALSARHTTLPFDPETIEDIFLDNLPDPLLMRISRTLVLELHVARLQGLLSGDTPDARFDSFIERLRQSAPAQAILTEYPVLARQLYQVVDQWADVCLEFLTRLTDDWNVIRDTFSTDEDPGVLVALAGGAGDTHRGGRSVMVLTFESGFRLVYKPKSLQVDAHFQDLLTWLNARGCTPHLETITVLDRGHYGWVEHVAYATCTSLDELRRFYRRHGAYLALLYALNANDFHFENLIAVGEHPILIDLETVLQPSFDTFNAALADSAAVKVMAESVLQVGLLPLRLWSGADYVGIDISGLGGNAGQLSPDRIPRVTEVGTDEMRYVRERIEIPGDNNRPSLNDEVISATEHADDILAGFTGIYQLLVQHRDELIAPDGPLAPFVNDDIRVLIRPTRTYDQLLFESFHPDLLRNALDRDQFLDRLWVAAPMRAYLSRVIPAEQADMQRGDIPIFETTPSGLHLVNGCGHIIEGVLHTTGMDTVRRRVQQLGDADIQRQRWFIRASLATIVDSADRPIAPGYRLQDTDVPADRARLLDAARAVADQLVATAVLGDDDVCWIGLDLMDEQTWEIRSMGIDLGSGLCGPVLFLAYAGEVLTEPRYTAMAQRGLRLIRRQIEMLREEVRGVGMLSGWGGVLVMFTHLAACWRDTEIAAEAAALVPLVRNLAVQDEELTIARGAAGALLALLAHHRATGADVSRQAAITCGNHLVASAKPTAHGVSWTLPDVSAARSRGAMHGAAGIAWALLELAASGGSERHRETALQAIAELRDTFGDDVTDWSVAHAPQLAGLTGIAPAWLAAMRQDTDPRLARELEAALQATLTHGFGQHHALLDGDLGNIEIVRACADALGDAWGRDQATRLTAMILTSITRDGWQCGGPLAVEMPGLTRGLAGIGYQLLRLADPERVPSLVLIAPPTAVIASGPDRVQFPDA